MALALAGEVFTFQVLWVDEEGSPLTVTSPLIDIFHFDGNGDKVALASTQSMVAVSGDTGRYAYVYSISALYAEPSPIYGHMSGVDPSTGLMLLEEMVVDVLDPSAGSSDLTILKDGSSIGTAVTSIDFIGVDVAADSPSSGSIRVFLPPPSYQSHWDTSDGDNGDQSVTESISRSTTRIPSPSGGEGTPFNTNGWADSNQATTTSSSVVFTTPSVTTGFGGDSTMTVTVYDADGTTSLETYTTGAITGDNTHNSGSGNISVVISNYAVDTLRYKAKATVTVNVEDVLADAGLTGGRHHVVVTHTTDSSSDGTGPYVYTQTAVFLDTNPSTPAINGTVTIAETGGQVLTKHLSGVEYYILNSQFTGGVTNIDGLNANTIRTSANLVLSGSEYGLSSLSHSPFGTGSSNFSGWTSAENQDDVGYSNTGWAITSSSYRIYTTTANISAYPRDPWASGSTQNSSNASILIDTYTSNSTALFEGFTDEDYRQDSGWNSGTTSGNWTSTASLSSGEAMVHNGQLMSPDAAAYQDWSAFSPTLGGANPNYTSLTVPVNYYRTFEDTSGDSRSSMTLTFSGTFVSNATTDLANSDLEVFVRRIASPTGDYGPSANPLTVHGGLYNFSSFDDGVSNGSIREGSSSGNTVNATFGGLVCEDGIFVHIRINNATIKIDSITVSFF